MKTLPKGLLDVFSAQGYKCVDKLTEKELKMFFDLLKAIKPSDEERAIKTKAVGVDGKCKKPIKAGMTNSKIPCLDDLSPKEKIILMKFITKVSKMLAKSEINNKARCI